MWVNAKSRQIAYKSEVIAFDRAYVHIYTMDLPTVNLDVFLADPASPEALDEAKKAAESLILTGALIVKDSRAPKEANDRFIDLFEDYFAQDREVLEKDERPECGYQVVSTSSHRSPEADGDRE
jgi:hypothetical protein